MKKDTASKERVRKTRIFNQALTLCMLINFEALLLSADFYQFFLNLGISQLNSLNPDQAPLTVGLIWV